MLTHLRSLLVLALLLSWPSAVLAQATPVLPLNTSAAAVFSHPSTGTDGYRLYIDGQRTGEYLVADVWAAGEVRLPIPPQATAGRHVLAASAFNSNGESRSADLPFFVGVPAPPGPVRIEITAKIGALVEPQADGTIKVRIEGVEAAAVVRDQERN